MLPRTNLVEAIFVVRIQVSTGRCSLLRLRPLDHTVSPAACDQLGSKTELKQCLHDRMTVESHGKAQPRLVSPRSSKRPSTAPSLCRPSTTFAEQLRVFVKHPDHTPDGPDLRYPRPSPLWYLYSLGHHREQLEHHDEHVQEAKWSRSSVNITACSWHWHSKYWIQVSIICSC